MTKAKLIEANNILSVYLNRLLQMSDDTNLFIPYKFKRA